MVLQGSRQSFMQKLARVCRESNLALNRSAVGRNAALLRLANVHKKYQRISLMPIDMPPARFVAAEPGMSR
jgi:hypothetical protein